MIFKLSRNDHTALLVETCFKRKALDFPYWIYINGNSIKCLYQGNGPYESLCLDVNWMETSYNPDIDRRCAHDWHIVTSGGLYPDMPKLMVMYLVKVMQGQRTWQELEQALFQLGCIPRRKVKFSRNFITSGLICEERTDGGSTRITLEELLLAWFPNENH